MELVDVMADVAEAIVAVDKSGIPFRSFSPGVGPYGEPQLLRLIAASLNSKPEYKERVQTKRIPDLLIPGEWAIEFKIARPYGDDGNVAENWSVNLLHPYRGNVSTIGDCLKLVDLGGGERKSVAVIGYEHTPPRIDLTPLVESFEAIAKHVIGIKLSPRVEIRRSGFIHPSHKSLRLFAWEVLGLGK